MESKEHRTKSDNKRIEDKKSNKKLKDELADVELQLTKLRESRTPVKKGRPVK